MTDTLEPCPWCGGQPVVTDDADGHYELMCSCPLSGINASTSCAGIDRDHAEERWNKLSASVRAAEETPKPHRAYTITLRVGGDTWRDALRMFEEYVEIVRERKPEEVNVTTGGPVNGGYVHVDIDADMTHERYVDALNVYLGKAARSSGARGGAE